MTRRGTSVLAGVLVWSAVLAGQRAAAQSNPDTEQIQPADKTARANVDRMIRVDLVVAAPVADVWAAWTTREGIASFFGRDARVELRVGGPYEVYFLMDAPIGNRGSEGCQVLSYVPGELLAFSWNAPPSMPAVRAERTQVVLRFEAVNGGRTRLHLTHLGWGTGDEWDAAFDYFSIAWMQVLASLEKRFADSTTEAPVTEKKRPQFVYFLEPVRATFLVDATETEEATVMEHFRYLQGLLAKGSLILAGRTAEHTPLGIVVFEADDLDAARRIMEQDPAVAAGVFKGRVAAYHVALLREAARQ